MNVFSATELYILNGYDGEFYVMLFIDCGMYYNCKFINKIDR